MGERDFVTAAGLEFPQTRTLGETETYVTCVGFSSPPFVHDPTLGLGQRAQPYSTANKARAHYLRIFDERFLRL